MKAGEELSDQLNPDSLSHFQQFSSQENEMKINANVNKINSAGIFPRGFSQTGPSVPTQSRIQNHIKTLPVP